MLAVIAPSSRNDLVTAGPDAQLARSHKPDYVWIAHRGLSPSACRRVVFYIHGGGFAKGDLAAFHHACSAFSRELNALLAFPLYGLCPEQPLDRTVDELTSCYQHVRQRMADIEIVVMADSAGGLLAALMLRALQEERVRLPEALVLLSPLLDLDLASPSIHENSDRDPLLDARLLQWLCALAKQRVDPRLISLDWNTLGYFPPTYLVASADEILRDDSKRLESALASRRVRIKAVYRHGLFHGFPLLHDDLPEAREALADIRGWLDAAGPTSD